MIINKLTYQEFESVLKPIITLESIEKIYINVSKVFHVPNYNLRESEDSGIKTVYEGFEIEISHIKWIDDNDVEHARIKFKLENEF